MRSAGPPGHHRPGHFKPTFLRDSSERPISSVYACLRRQKSALCLNLAPWIYENFPLVTFIIVIKAAPL